jgi:hypothetical protein
MNKGILTIALKHPLYGRFAYNLALSIKAGNYNQKVSVIADDIALSHLNEGHKMIFDKIIKPSDDDWKVNGKELPLYCKFNLFNLTPYLEETLFVDADMIFSVLCDYNKLWNDMKAIEWTMANRGENEPNKGISEWVDNNVLNETYPNVEQWYDLSSEWIYWKQNEIADSIFAKAKDFYLEGKLLTRSFAGDKPDEPFFNLSIDSLKHKLHKSPFQPTYWLPSAKKLIPILDIKKNYFAFSVGGNHVPKQQEKIYNDFAKNASYKMNLPTFPIMHKRSHLKERNLI